MFALNFISPHNEMLLKARHKTATIRPGDIRDIFSENSLVWITFGEKYGPKTKLYQAIIDRALVNDRSNRVSLVIEKKTGPEKIPIEAAYWSDAVHKERYEVLRLLAAEEDAKVRERREQLKEDEKRRAEEARQVAAYSSAML